MSAFPVESQDLLSPELTADPHEYFETLRRHDPVHWNEPAKGWLHTRYADISDAMFDPRLSSNRALPLLDSMTPERREVMAPMLQTISRWMVVNDPPVHTRLRKLSNAAFRQQRVVAMGEWIAEMVDDLLDEFIASGDNDLLGGFANQLPAMTIARMLGAPDEDLPKIHEWSEELGLVAFGGGGEARPDRHSRALVGIREMEQYLHVLIEKVRREPGQDMISVLVHDQSGDSDDRLTDDEIAAMSALILLAGHETTANLLTNAVVTLTRHPEQLDLLVSSPELVKGAVEEVLRYEGPVKVLTRWVTEDHERGGRTIKEGERVLLVQPSGNRDAEMFPDGDVFDIQRPTQPLHLGFGRGIHACIGAQLARLEARVALPKLLQRLPGLAVVGDVDWAPSFASRGVNTLPISYQGMRATVASRRDG
jgi:cytochrome P450